MEQFLPAVALLALIAKFTDFLKSLTNKDVNAAITQLVVWGSGIAAVVLYAQTQWANTIAFADVPLADMNGASLIAIGLGIGSTASLAFDYKKAKDTSDSAKTPPLTGGGTPPAN